MNVIGWRRYRPILQILASYSMVAGLLAFMLVEDGHPLSDRPIALFRAFVRGFWHQGRLGVPSQLLWCLTASLLFGGGYWFFLRCWAAGIKLPGKSDITVSREADRKWLYLMGIKVLFYCLFLLTLLLLIAIVGGLQSLSLDDMISAISRGFNSMGQSDGLSPMVIIFAAWPPLSILIWRLRHHSGEPQFVISGKATVIGQAFSGENGLTGKGLEKRGGVSERSPGIADALPPAEKAIRIIMVVLAVLSASLAMASLHGLSLSKTATEIASIIVSGGIMVVAMTCNFHGAIKSGRLSGPRLLANNSLWLKLLWLATLLIALAIPAKLVLLTINNPVQVTWSEQCGSLFAFYGLLFSSMSAAFAARFSPTLRE